MAQKKSRKRRRTARLLLVVAAAVIVILGVILIISALGRVLSSGGGDNDTNPTTTASDSTTATTRPTALFVDGHYVQQRIPAWNLQLVNGWNPLPADYGFEDNLVDFGSGRMFDTRAAEALRQMLAAGGEYGLRPVSLFRAYDHQVKLYNNEVAEWKQAGYSQAEAEQKASTEVARPGTSEHHLGLAADILSDGVYSLEETFENTAAFTWLKEHCAEYGFILRYPKEKEDITGVIYEPWHYRYVGVEAAREIMSRGICLEEYLAEVYR
ncbi:MAG: D-alanyl-D-alanine carboxypeptidase family protein [Ruminococcaceae bacterium]|nr:D-alanyl-D-alanine carboxypeptidase family protein [Oscillospiraceae bacterium]